MIVTGSSFPSLAAAVTSCSFTIYALIVVAVGEVIKMRKQKQNLMAKGTAPLLSESRFAVELTPHVTHLLRYGCRC